MASQYSKNYQDNYNSNTSRHKEIVQQVITVQNISKLVLFTKYI